MDAGAIRVWDAALAKIAKDEQWIGMTEKIGSVPRVLSRKETATCVQEQYETYFKLGKALGIELN